MTYLRVIPRDLFNEANLLKCYGRLWLLLEPYLGKGVEFIHDHDAFEIEQNPDDGSLTILNITLMIQGERVSLHRPLNSREGWPLYATLRDQEISVFDDEGNLSDDFKEWLGGLSRRPL